MSDNKELKTSEEWQKLCKILIYDADGWDRTPDGWDYSWKIEKITRDEFEKRLCSSTIMSREDIPKDKQMKKHGENMWLDKENN